MASSLVKMDASDACSTQLFNPQTMEWEQEVLDYVMGSIDEDDAYERVKGGKRLKQMLGEVERDGAKPVHSRFLKLSFSLSTKKLTEEIRMQVGTISDYMSKRFGFAPGEFSFLSEFSPSEAYSLWNSQIVSSFPSPVHLPLHSSPTRYPTLPRSPLPLLNAKSFSPFRPLRPTLSSLLLPLSLHLLNTSSFSTPSMLEKSVIS